MATNIEKTKRYVKSLVVRDRYGGLTPMTLYRWVRDPVLSFPKPIVVNGVRYFAIDELDSFDERQREAALRRLALDPFDHKSKVEGEEAAANFEAKPD